MTILKEADKLIELVDSLMHYDDVLDLCYEQLKSIRQECWDEDIKKKLAVVIDLMEHI